MQANSGSASPARVYPMDMCQILINPMYVHGRSRPTCGVVLQGIMLCATPATHAGAAETAEHETAEAHRRTAMYLGELGSSSGM